jgi:hypothetical protein
MHGSRERIREPVYLGIEHSLEQPAAVMSPHHNEWRWLSRTGTGAETHPLCHGYSQAAMSRRVDGGQMVDIFMRKR